MSCDETRILLDGYLDDELGLVHSLDVEKHVGECAKCGGTLATLRSLRSALTSEELRFPVPRGMEQRIRAGLDRETSGYAHQTRRLLPVAAGLLFAVALGLGSFSLGRRTAEDRAEVSEVVSAHVRSLLPGRLADVPSSDQHTVKPWFNGRLNFSPPVKDFAAQGFPLTGGRLEYLDGRPAAALIYQRRKHFINLFIQPEQGSDSTIATAEKNGFNILGWRAGSYRFWAVSDVNLTDLQAFATLVQAP